MFNIFFQYINSFIDKAYFLADAYEKGYDTMAETQRWVHAMEHYAISSPGGLLDESMVASVTEHEIQEALKRNSRHFCKGSFRHYFRDRRKKEI